MLNDIFDVNNRLTPYYVEQEHNHDYLHHNAFYVSAVLVLAEKLLPLVDVNK